MKVGVFVDAPADRMQEIAGHVGLDALQLHGSETPAVLRGLSTRVIKAIPLGGPDVDEQIAQWSGTTLLLDAHDPARRGGTGRVVDWVSAAAIARHHEVILAGGLNPENVAEAVRQVRPAGVDVSSGVEQTPGVKDMVKLAALFDALAGAEV